MDLSGELANIYALSQRRKLVRALQAVEKFSHLNPTTTVLRGERHTTLCFVCVRLQILKVIGSWQMAKRRLKRLALNDVPFDAGL